MDRILAQLKLAKLFPPRDVELGEIENGAPNANGARDTCKTILIVLILLLSSSILAYLVCSVAIMAYETEIIRTSNRDPTLSREDDGIWSGYRLQFFLDERVSFKKAESVCASRNATLLAFKDDQQESLFDLYVGTNFWDEKIYKELQFWTGGVFTMWQQSKFKPYYLWPDRPRIPFVGDGKRECYSWRRGLYQKGAFNAKTDYVTEVTIVKDYQSTNLVEDDRKDAEGNKITDDSIPGCWNRVKRIDVAPEQFHRFVCQCKLMDDEIDKKTKVCNPYEI